MAATAEIITKPVASAISLRWIISARDDAIWFIGSVVSSYVLLILYVSGLVPLVPMVAAWAILIDAPHVFGTFSRTYFDRTERKNRPVRPINCLCFLCLFAAKINRQQWLRVPK